jgi:hypothetical protein
MNPNYIACKVPCRAIYNQGSNKSGWMEIWVSSSRLKLILFLIAIWRV